jgi:hypothetical protein
MSIDRKNVEKRIATLMEASLDAERILEFLGPEGGQNQILDHVVAISEEYRKAFEKQFNGPLPEGKAPDDAGAELFGLPSVNELMDFGTHTQLKSQSQSRKVGV